MHFVLLAGTDTQIDQSKGSSPLSAVEIRANMNALNRGPVATSAATPGAQALQFVLSSAPENNASISNPTLQSDSPEPLSHSLERNQLAKFHADERPVSATPASKTQVGFDAEFSGDDFRQWIDAI